MYKFSAPNDFVPQHPQRLAVQHSLDLSRAARPAAASSFVDARV